MLERNLRERIAMKFSIDTIAKYHKFKEISLLLNPLSANTASSCTTNHVAIGIGI